MLGPPPPPPPYPARTPGAGPPRPAPAGPAPPDTISFLSGLAAGFRAVRSWGEMREGGREEGRRETPHTTHPHGLLVW
jgi:hypothetical protein